MKNLRSRLLTADYSAEAAKKWTRVIGHRMPKICKGARFRFTSCNKNLLAITRHWAAAYLNFDSPSGLLQATRVIIHHYLVRMGKVEATNEKITCFVSTSKRMKIIRTKIPTRKAKTVKWHFNVFQPLISITFSKVYLTSLRPKNASFWRPKQY